MTSNSLKIESQLPNINLCHMKLKLIIVYKKEVKNKENTSNRAERNKRKNS